MKLDFTIENDFGKAQIVEEIIFLYNILSWKSQEWNRSVIITITYLNFEILFERTAMIGYVIFID